VLGGGYIGVEMAQAYRRFGSRVTIIEPGPQIMGREDADVAAEIGKILSSEGIDILVGAQPLRVEGVNGQSVSMTVRTAVGERKIESSHLLIATGRVANTADIGLDKAGVALTERGFIQVDAGLRTTAPGVWAIGECAGSPQFTHVSADDFRIVRDNMAGGDRRTDDRLIPHVVFTDPPLARIGLSEGEAQHQGILARIAKLPMRRILRTLATDEAEGFMKLLISEEDDRILGFTMIGSEAGEVATVIQAAMLAGLPYTKLRDAVLAHLTIAEGLGALFENVPTRPL
jgi:pyruvate/2-oxoglutarate dehydrogenase complex dihydrolipoamide dehydrogenase (E3) component